MEAMREADVAEIKADVTKLAESAKVDVAFNPLADIKNQITGAIEGEARLPSTAIGADTPALPSPYEDGPSLNSIELPRLPLTAGDGDVSPGDAGAAPVSPDPEPGAPSPNGIEAEMKALASALEAEMAAAPPPVAGSQAQPQEKA
jgi:sec-independent protein translocase protein TatB